LAAGAAAHVAAAVLGEDLPRQNLLDGGVMDFQFRGAHGGKGQEQQDRLFDFV
jgi:hypothetical protein